MDAESRCDDQVTVDPPVVLDAMSRCRRGLLTMLSGTTIAMLVIAVGAGTSVGDAECRVAGVVVGLCFGIPALVGALLTLRVRVEWSDWGLRYRSRWRTVNLPRESISALGWFVIPGMAGGAYGALLPALYGADGRLAAIVPVSHLDIAKELGVRPEQVERLLEGDADRLGSLFKPRIPDLPAGIWQATWVFGAMFSAVPVFVAGFAVCRLVS